MIFTESTQSTQSTNSQGVLIYFELLQWISNSMPKLIETIDLVTNFYTYEGVVKALNRIALVLEEGVTFGLVGESGCGKSVFARSIMRIVPEPGRIEAGKIILFLNEKEAANGIDLLQQSEAYLEGLRGDQISMIFQEPNAALNPTMSVGEQVAESYLIHQQSDLCNRIIKDLETEKSSSLSPMHRFQRIQNSLVNIPVLETRNRILRLTGHPRQKTDQIPHRRIPSRHDRRSKRPLLQHRLA